ncbi:MAG: hypothetical protein QG608_2347 [Actinomycetota bacterium]|nr:hypothetical protein [Actinomycetota bacterium]
MKVMVVGDHFTIDVSVSDLMAAEAIIGALGSQLTEEGRKLGGLPDQASSWTGTTARTLKAEMSRVSDQMVKSTEHFATAQTAVATFRRAVEEAEDTLLPGLNRRWSDAETACSQDTRRAETNYERAKQTAGHSSSGAGTARDYAVRAAVGRRDSARVGLTGEYDELVHELEQKATACGAAMAQSVLAAVPASIVASYLRGGGRGRGSSGPGFDTLTASTRQALAGDNTLVGQADDYRAGLQSARELRNSMGPAGTLTAAQVAQLEENGRNAAWVQGLMTELGPGGMAALGYTVRYLFEDGQPEIHQRGQEALAALSTVFATGSSLKVDDGHGGTRLLMDAAWLKNYNPNQELGLDPDLHLNYIEGYRPDLLLPFLGSTLDAEFTQVLADQSLKDYEAYLAALKKHDDDALDRWMLYRGADRLSGPESILNIQAGRDDNPFRTDMFHTVLDRTAEHADVSNFVMMRHFDAMAGLLTGVEPQLVGVGSERNWAGDSLGKILEQSVLGVGEDDRHLADSVVSRLGNYLHKDADNHLIPQGLSSLGKIVTDERYLTGQIHSVATPFAPALEGYDAVTGGVRDPRLGLLLPREIWAELDQEAMRSPENVLLLSERTENWLQGEQDKTVALSVSWDPDKLGPGGVPLTDPNGNPYHPHPNGGVTALNMFQRESVRAFFAGNLVAVQGDLEKELGDRLAAIGEDRKMAKGAVSKIFELAQDPAAIKANVPVFVAGVAIDTLAGPLTDFLVEAVGDFDGQESAAKAAYDEQLNTLRGVAGGDFADPKPWTDINRLSNSLLSSMEGGNGPAPVYTKDSLSDANPEYFTGSLDRYIGHQSEYVSGGTMITDDFVVREDGAPTVMDYADMNHLQREAYLNWLHDPAVQQFMSVENDELRKARGLGQEEQDDN